MKVKKKINMNSLLDYLKTKKKQRDKSAAVKLSHKKNVSLETDFTKLDSFYLKMNNSNKMEKNIFTLLSPSSILNKSPKKVYKTKPSPKIYLEKKELFKKEQNERKKRQNLTLSKEKAKKKLISSKSKPNMINSYSFLKHNNYLIKSKLCSSFNNEDPLERKYLSLQVNHTENSYDYKPKLKQLQNILLQLKNKKSKVIDNEINKIFSKVMKQKKTSISVKNNETIKIQPFNIKPKVLQSKLKRIENNLNNIEKEVNIISENNSKIKSDLSKNYKELNQIYQIFSMNGNNHIMTEGTKENNNESKEDKDLLKMDTLDFIKKCKLENKDNYYYFQPRNKALQRINKSVQKVRWKLPTLDFVRYI
ncbi:MAG: hypothetical protein MJ252_04825 [archaeon]|nr:hypothetical protein [archaeon]